MAKQPYRMGSEKACDYCNYRSICQFDETKQNHSFRNIKKLTKDEVLKKISENEGPLEEAVEMEE